MLIKYLLNAGLYLPEAQKSRKNPGPFPTASRLLPWKIGNCKSNFNHTNSLFLSIEARAPETTGFSREPHMAYVQWKFPMYIYKAVVPVERVRRSCAAALLLP